MPGVGEDSRGFRHELRNRNPLTNFQGTERKFLYDPVAAATCLIWVALGLGLNVVVFLADKAPALLQNEQVKKAFLGE